MIGLVGATGTIGRHLLSDLEALKVPVTCLQRRSSQASIKAARSTRVVKVDLNQPETLKTALSGCRSLFLLTGPDPNLSTQQLPVLQAASEAGIEHVVKLSAGDPVLSENSASQIGREHWRVEQELMRSGLDWTMLRPGFFMQNFTAMAAAIRTFRAVALPVPPHMTVGMVDAADIAAVAAVVLVEGAFKGEVVSLAGESYLMCDFPLLLSHVLGQEVTYEQVTLDAAAEGMKAAGMPDWMISQQLEVLQLMAAGAFSAGKDRHFEVTGRKRRSLSDFVRTNLDHFRPE